MNRTGSCTSSPDPGPQLPISSPQSFIQEVSSLLCFIVLIQNSLLSRSTVSPLPGILPHAQFIMRSFHLGWQEHKLVPAGCEVEKLLDLLLCSGSLSTSSSFSHVYWPVLRQQVEGILCKSQELSLLWHLPCQSSWCGHPDTISASLAQGGHQIAPGRPA